jgi:CRP-like cAMP-binding protein
MDRLGSHFVRNLSVHNRFSPAEQELLEAAITKSVREIPAGKDLIHEGDPPRSIKVVLDGWVMRYKDLPNGHRQILALMIPGDICDANAFILEHMDHSLGAVTNVHYAEICQHDFEALMASSPKITRALWRSELVTVSIQREWTLNLGQRHAMQKIAHLFCEMFTRLRRLNLTNEDSCEFPLTQIQIAEATGLTPVHVNRMLQDMRTAGLIELRGRRLFLRDRPGLEKLAMFQSAYLHI